MVHAPKGKAKLSIVLSNPAKVFDHLGQRNATPMILVSPLYAGIQRKFCLSRCSWDALPLESALSSEKLFGLS